MSDASPPPKAPTPRTPRPCPICGQPADAKLRPFCSPRCADVDLGRWLTGRYAITAAAEDDDGPPDERSA